MKLSRMYSRTDWIVFVYSLIKYIGEQNEKNDTIVIIYMLASFLL